jgi:6-phospho-3-hexuloisomerase
MRKYTVDAATPPNRPWLDVGGEVAALLADLDSVAFDAALGALRPDGRRWFTTGQGRSGLVSQMIAMRLMHLGRTVHVLGESTSPAMRAGDGLLVISGSGTTPVSLHFTRRAAQLGCRVLAVTADPASPLGMLAETVLPVPPLRTSQFGGSLFEQGALLVLDALVMSLVAEIPDAHELMHGLHANMQ